MSRTLVALAAIVAVISLTACDPPAPPPGDDGGPPPTTECTGDGDCDDGLFCTGPERCLPGDERADSRGCVPMPPCMETQRCLEAEDRCATSCAIAPDADGDGAEAESCGGADCDDTDANRFPGATEVCDPEDVDEDCDPTTYGSRDADGDGFVDATCCNVPDDGGAMRCGDDCSDHRRDAHPGNTEACEGIDNDCDGAVDEMLLVAHYRDSDFDLHGATGTRTEVCPGTPGFSLVDDDCDDSSPVRHGAQLELCDGIDNDCDGEVDEAPVAVAWYPDEDGDLFGAPPSDPADTVISCMPVPGYSTRSSDCNDADAMIHPGAREICNAADDDCNGRADAPGLSGGDSEDDDGDGEPDQVCGGGDCDDANDAVRPRAIELCDMIDNDCDGVVDGGSAMAMWYADADRDGYGDTATGAPAPITSCDPQSDRVPRGGDCDDSDATVHPRAADFCDGEDADCDGSIDENGIRFAFFPDADGDGWGSTAIASIVYRCTAPTGTVARTGDCNDTDADVYPTAPELCEGADNDCDVAVDEDSDQSWYADADGDGHGRGTPIVQCTRPPGRVLLGDDCDDMNAGNFPGNTESCNGRDDDCDAMADDGASAACATLPNAAASTCSAAGACTVVCDANFGNCDGSAASGCEVDLRRSASYCGACTTSCGPGDTCGLEVASTCDLSPIVSIVAGDSSGHWMLAVRESGGVVAWGTGAENVTTSTVNQPQPLSTGVGGAVQVVTGLDISCARTVAGRLICWGDNGSGQFGTGTTGGPLRGPTEIPLDYTDRVVDVDAGYQHVCAVRASGQVWCWGWNPSGQLGIGTPPAGMQYSPPTAMVGVTDAVAVACVDQTTCVLRGPSGARYVTCTGFGLNGERGDGTTASSNVASTSVLGLPGTAIDITGSNGRTGAFCSWTSDGRGYCWGGGGGTSMGTGAGPSVDHTSATLIPTLSGVAEIQLGYNSGCARVRGAAAGSFEVWCWGGTSSTMPWIDGVTGSSAGTSVTTPIRAGTAAVPISDAVAIAVAQQTWCAIRAGGGVVCMGNDTFGALGNGPPFTNVFSPTPVLGLP